eukprot:6460554-Amphidinium_carterae.1
MSVQNSESIESCLATGGWSLNKSKGKCLLRVFGKGSAHLLYQWLAGQWQGHESLVDSAKYLGAQLSSSDSALALWRPTELQVY